MAPINHGASHARPLSRAILLTLTPLITGTAHASGEFRVRAYTVPAPLDWRDSLEISGRYQTRGGLQGSAMDFSVSRAQQALTGRIYAPHHQFQTNLRRSDAGGTRAVTGTLSYTYVPELPASGPAMTSVTGYTTFSHTDSLTVQTQTGTVGVAGSARLREGLAANLNASTTATRVAGREPTWGAAATGSLTYAQGDTSGYLAPSITVQSGRTSYSVTAGGSVPLDPTLSLSASGTLSPSTPPTVTATLTSRQTPLNLSLSAGYSSGGATIGTGARLNTDSFSVGAALNVALATHTPQLQLDATRRTGPLTFTASAALTDPTAKRTLNLRGSVTATRAPWNGNLNLNYTRQPTGDTGSATGSLSYTTAHTSTTAALALALSRRPGQSTVVTGTADLSATAFLTPQLGVSGNARYERSTAPGAPPLYRVGLGLTYRFDQEESK